MSTLHRVPFPALRAAFLAVALLIGAAAAVPAQITAISGNADYELIGTYDLPRLEQVFTTDLDDFMASSTLPTGFRGKFAPPKYPVKLYRVHYRSVVPELDNRPTRASGLVAIPDTGETAMPLVSYQHGTIFDKSYVPSNPDASMETRVMLAVFAAQGYIVIGADYFGRGDSDLPDSFLVREATQQAGVDMFLTARDMLGQMGITADASVRQRLVAGRLGHDAVPAQAGGDGHSAHRRRRGQPAGRHLPGDEPLAEQSATH